MNILLVDDHKLFREGMRYVLEAGLRDETNGEFVIYEAADSNTAVRCAQQHPELDLVLMDLNLPDSQGLSGLQAFIRRFPVLPVVVLSASTQRSDITRSLEAGAMGFIPKDSSSSAVVNAIRLVLTGNIYVPPVLLDQEVPVTASNGTQGSSGLTGRQQEVIQLIAEGKSNKEIARQLNLAETTVKMHVTHIMRTLDVSNRTQAVVKAERLGLVAID